MLTGTFSLVFHFIGIFYPWNSQKVKIMTFRRQWSCRFCFCKSTIVGNSAGYQDQLDTYAAPCQMANRMKASDSSARYGCLSENSILTLVFMVLTWTAPERILCCKVNILTLYKHVPLNISCLSPCKRTYAAACRNRRNWLAENLLQEHLSEDR
mgnify:FL=1